MELMLNLDTKDMKKVDNHSSFINHHSSIIIRHSSIFSCCFGVGPPRVGWVFNMRTVHHWSHIFIFEASIVSIHNLILFPVVWCWFYHRLQCLMKRVDMNWVLLIFILLRKMEVCAQYRLQTVHGDDSWIAHSILINVVISWLSRHIQSHVHCQTILFHQIKGATLFFIFILIAWNQSNLNFVLISINININTIQRYLHCSQR